MAISSGQVVVGATGATAAAQVVVAAASTYTQTIGGQAQPSRNVVLSNGSGATVYIAGTTGVTGPSNGFPLAASTSLSLPLHFNEAICVVAFGTTGSTIQYLATGG